MCSASASASNLAMWGSIWYSLLVRAVGAACIVYRLGWALAAEDIGEFLAGYDVEAARALLGQEAEGVLPPRLRRALLRLVANLQMYRPYILPQIPDGFGFLMTLDSCMPNNPAALDRSEGGAACRPGGGAGGDGFERNRREARPGACLQGAGGSSGARGLSARTDIRHRELAGERAQLVQPDADDRLAALRGKPCDECRDDGARREMARPRDQQLVEDEHRERPHAHAGHHRRINPVGGDNTEDDHPHRPRLDQRHRD
eukprot:gene13846-biopygen7415